MLLGLLHGRSSRLQKDRPMSALRKNTIGFVVQPRAGSSVQGGVFVDYETSTGSIRVMDKKTFDGAVGASNKLIRETVNKIRAQAEKCSDE